MSPRPKRLRGGSAVAGAVLAAADRRWPLVAAFAFAGGAEPGTIVA
jgi:hypothetical protein